MKDPIVVRLCGFDDGASMLMRRIIGESLAGKKYENRVAIQVSKDEFFTTAGEPFPPMIKITGEEDVDSIELTDILKSKIGSEIVSAELIPLDLGM